MFSVMLMVMTIEENSQNGNNRKSKLKINWLSLKCNYIY